MPSTLDLIDYLPVNRTERLLDLITYLLNAREPVSWQEIKNHFPDDYSVGIEESNQRKFERDKAELLDKQLMDLARAQPEWAKKLSVIEGDPAKRRVRR